MSKARIALLALTAVVLVGLGVGADRLIRLPGKAAPEAFVPPPDSAIPDDEFGAQVRLGRAIFTDTARLAPQFVGNDLKCSNCHLDAGRLANSSPMWGAFGLYPAYRSKTKHVDSFAERLQGCFQYSMNGKAPPYGDPVLVALESYSKFLAQGAPVGVVLPGQGYPELPKPASPPDRVRGQQIYQANCAMCHGADGQGQKARDGETVFPAVWGPRSYNWGAGMGRIDKAAAFIAANMPFSKGGSLSEQQAWDVAAYIDGKPRPQDPRFTGDLAETRAKFNNTPQSLYGTEVDGVLLGDPNGPLQ